MNLANMIKNTRDKIQKSQKFTETNIPNIFDEEEGKTPKDIDTPSSHDDSADLRYTAANWRKKQDQWKILPSNTAP